MHFTSAIPIVIPCPFMDTAADRRMSWMTTPVALLFVGVQPRAASWIVFGHEGTARPRVCVVASPTHKRCSPVSRERMLMMGGRSLA
jgi:hypothetical protein